MKQDKDALSKFLRAVRDVLVLAAIDVANVRRSQDEFNNAPRCIFGHALDLQLQAQMDHTCHQLLRRAPGEFTSNC